MNKALLCLLVAALATPFAPPVYADQMEEVAMMQEFLKVMDGYYDLIDSIYATASNREKAAIQQIQKIEEIYKDRGDRAEAIKYMTKILGSTKSATVRNALVMMLADALNETGQASQAVEVLKSALQDNLK